MKLLLYTICYIIYPFSFLFVRNKKRYAFGSFRGSFNDNAKYLFIYTVTNCPDIDAAWVSINKDTVKHIRTLGLKAYSVFSIRGAWHALTAGYWFFNSYTSDIMYCLSGGATCINLWHGVGIKRLEYNITSGPLAARYNRTNFKEVYTHPESFRKPDYIISSTPYQTVFFSTSFRVPKEHCLEFGYARNEILVENESSRLDFIARYESGKTRDIVEELRSYKKVYIYMPTWRDSQLDAFVQHIDLVRFNKLLSDNNELLLLKPHANVHVDSSVQSLTNIRLLDGKMDVYPILPYTDVLITDYSSIIYDYLLMTGKSVILYLYDYNEYVADRDFYYPFDENVTGRRVYTFDELMECVAKHDYVINEQERQRILDRFWGDTVNFNSCQKLLDFISVAPKKE